MKNKLPKRRAIVSKVYSKNASPEVVQEVLNDALKEVKNGETIEAIEPVDCNESSLVFVIYVEK